MSTFSGHAIECRINAENPFTFQPSPGLITQFHTPGGLGVRFDSAIYAGYRIPPYYDSLTGKLIVHGRSRNECLMRLRRALDELVVGGIETTIPLFQQLLRERDIIDGNYNIHWLENISLPRARNAVSNCKRRKSRAARTTRHTRRSRLWRKATAGSRNSLYAEIDKHLCFFHGMHRASVSQFRPHVAAYSPAHSVRMHAKEHPEPCMSPR